MPVVPFLLSTFCSSIKNFLRLWVYRTRHVFRWFFYSLRFIGQNITIDPSSYVGVHAILRCTDGGAIQIGKNCEIHNYALIDAAGGVVHMGDDCSLNPFAVLYGHGGTTIGDRVRIATHAVIVPANHIFRSFKPFHESGLTVKGIVIENDVWIGSGAKILDGVLVSSRSVIGAGAVVTRAVPSFSIATGAPARCRTFDPLG